MTDNIQKAFNSGIVVATAKMLKRENDNDETTINLDVWFFVPLAMHEHGFKEDDIDPKLLFDT